MLGAGAGHGRAEEDVDDQHDEEENAEGDAEIEKPDRGNPTALADVRDLNGQSSWGYMNEDRDKKQEFKTILPNLRNRPRRLLSIYPKNDCNIELTWFNYKNRIRSHESAIIRRLDKRVSLWL